MSRSRHQKRKILWDDMLYDYLDKVRKFLRRRKEPLLDE